MKEHGDNYGYGGYSNTPSSNLNPGYNQYSMSGANGANGVPRSGVQAPPPPPHKDMNAPRVPMKLGKSQSREQPPPVTEKRKSWFGKRFSKA